LVPLGRRPRHRAPVPVSIGAGDPGHAAGRPKTTGEIRVQIRRLAEENPDWGAPKIHGEILKLGFVVSERSVV
jgi:hypothetical protein